MSLTDLAARRASATCPTCLDRRVVTVEGKAQAIARRCPSCDAICASCSAKCPACGGAIRRELSKLTSSGFDAFKMRLKCEGCSATFDELPQSQAGTVPPVPCKECSVSCARCGGGGYTYTEDDTGAVVAHPCECLGIQSRIDLFNAARVPRRYVRASLWPLGAGALDDRGKATPIGTEDVNASLRAATLELGRRTQGFTPGDRGIGLTGPVGCGKTHLMAALVRALTLDDGVPCRFVEFTHLLAELREGFEHGTGSAGLISQAVEVPVLVIDELGKGLTTEWQMAILDELVSKRYNAQVTTFFTSNYPTEKADRGGASSRERFEVTTLEDRIGARMYSRLLEMCDILAVDAPDYRKRSVR